MAEASKNNVKRELRLGIVLSYFLIALNVVSGFLLVPFIIRGIGQSNYGLYTAASSLITMFIVDLGLGTAVTKFISKYRVISTQQEINKLVSVVFYCFLGLAGILLVIFSIIFPLLPNIYSSFTPQELADFRIVFLIVASYSVITFPFMIVNGMLVAYDKIFLAKLADIISKIVFIVITVIVLALNLGLFFLTACYAVHGIVGIALKVFFVKWKTPTRFFSRMSAAEFWKIFKEVIAFSIWAAINSFGRVILISFAPTILGFSSAEGQGTGEIAVLSVATQIESYVSLFATAFGSIFYPSISRILFARGQVDDESRAEFHAFHIRIARIQVAILALVIVGLILCGQSFINLWVGAGYEKSYYCILAICIPALFFYPLQTAENAMAAIEKIKYCAISTIIATVVGIVSCIIFAYPWGTVGVSVGICIGFMTRTILFNVFFRRYLRIKPFYFYFKAYASFIIPSLAAVGAGVVLNMALNGDTWIIFAAKVLAITSVYLVALALFGLTRQEKDRVDGFLRRTYEKAAALIERTQK